MSNAAETLQNSSSAALVGRKRFAKPFMLSVITAGALVTLYSAWTISAHDLTLNYILLATLTCLIGTRLNITIPRIGGKITVSDTFLFLTVLLYGPAQAVLLAAIESLISSTRYSKKAITIIFNSAGLAFSTFATAWILTAIFGDITTLATGEYSAGFIVAICLMAFIQYVLNSSLVSIAAALKNDQPIWYTWSHYYLWTSITYFAGASAAGIVAKFIGVLSFYATLITAPIIAIIYFTYHMYLKNVEASVSQAEQAERHVEELSRYIAEQERIREQFSQIEKLSALGELASGVAHNFNNTLAGILGRAQLLMRTDDQEKIRSGLQIIIKTAEDGAKIVKRIQDFAQQRKNHDFSPVAVEQLLLDVAEITRPRWKDSSEAAGKHISMEIKNTTNGLVMGDASELREVMVNIVFNAVDAMPNGGHLVLGSKEKDGSIEIYLKDSGVGMSPEVRSRIFDPFFTTKGKGGLGLGLAVSYGIIRRHEGTIEVDSEIGQGTTFRITLPVAKGDVKQAETDYVAPIARPPQEVPTKFLVVDDEAIVRELLRDILESEGHTAVLASGGREAVSLYSSGNFDAMFTDIGMPGMSGWELVRAIREMDKQTPIAVLTGWGEVVDSKEQGAAEVNWVLSKPFTIDKIIELAQEITKIKEKRSATKVPGQGEFDSIEKFSNQDIEMIESSTIN
jgi:signal transduction histidine kinase/FixJ family two-component response regulator